MRRRLWRAFSSPAATFHDTSRGAPDAWLGHSLQLSMPMREQPALWNNLNGNLNRKQRYSPTACDRIGTSTMPRAMHDRKLGGRRGVKAPTALLAVGAEAGEGKGRPCPGGRNGQHAPGMVRYLRSDMMRELQIRWPDDHFANPLVSKLCPRPLRLSGSSARP